MHGDILEKFKRKQAIDFIPIFHIPFAEEKKIGEESKTYFQQFSSCQDWMLAERRFVEHFAEDKWNRWKIKEEQREADLEAKLGKAFEVKMQLDEKIARSKAE